MTHRITIVGLGVGELEQLPFGIYRLLKIRHNPSICGRWTIQSFQNLQQRE